MQYAYYIVNHCLVHYRIKVATIQIQEYQERHPEKVIFKIVRTQSNMNSDSTNSELQGIQWILTGVLSKSLMESLQCLEVEAMERYTVLLVTESLTSYPGHGPCFSTFSTSPAMLKNIGWPGYEGSHLQILSLLTGKRAGDTK